MTSCLQILNIGDVSTWMNQETLEDEDGFATKSILCTPIVNGQKTVIGVAQLINKVTGVANRHSAVGGSVTVCPIAVNASQFSLYKFERA